LRTDGKISSKKTVYYNAIEDYYEKLGDRFNQHNLSACSSEIDLTMVASCKRNKSDGEKLKAAAAATEAALFKLERIYPNHIEKNEKKQHTTMTTITTPILGLKASRPKRYIDINKALNNNKNNNNNNNRRITTNHHHNHHNQHLKSSSSSSSIEHGFLIAENKFNVINGNAFGYI
jgi:hypothetical protein